MEKSTKIFLAAFFGDQGALQELVKSEADFTIRFRPEYDSFNFEYTKSAVIELPELIQLLLEAWYDQRNRTDNYHESRFCGKEVYDKVAAMDAWLQQTFPGYKRSPVDYEKYYFIYGCRGQNEDFYDQEDMRTYEASGVRRIDLDLVNSVEKGRRQEVIDLLTKGGNPFAIIEGDSWTGDYMDAICCGDHFNWLVSWHEKYVQHGLEYFTEMHVSQMMTLLPTYAREGEFFRLAFRHLHESIEVPEWYKRYLNE